MENRSSGSGADALASGGLAGAIVVGAESPPPPPPPLEETTNAKTAPKELELEGAAGETRDIMDLDVPPSAAAAAEVSAVAPPLPPPDTPPPQIVSSDRTMTTPPPPPSRPLANATPTHTPSTTATTTQHQQQQTPRDLRQILQAAGSVRPGFPRHGSVPPSPVVKPGALHEFEVLDSTSPATRRRSSATAGIAGLEELRNRIEAEKGNRFRPANGDAGPFDQLIQATTGAGEYGDFLSNQHTHVIDAFVRLDFDDGHVFYVRNSSVVFGRAEGASSNSFQQLGPDGSTVIGSNPFGGFDPTTTPGAMSMKREKKKRRKKKGDTSTGTPVNKSTTSGASSAGYPDSSRRGSAFAHRQTFPMFRDGSATNFPFPFPAPSHEVPIIHLPLTTSDVEAAAAPPRKNISRKHAVLNYNFAKRRFELKITGKNGAFVEDEFVQCDTTWVVGSGGMRVQIGGVGFKVVVPVVPGGGFDSVPKGRGKGGKGKMSTSFTDEHGNEVQTDFSDDEDEDEEMEQVDGSGGGGSDESMEDSDESGDEDDEEEEEEEEGEGVEDDEEAQEGDVELSEGESEEEESDEEVEAAPLPEPIIVEKKRGRGRPRKDEAEIARQELERARVREKAKEKERRHKEKLDAVKRAKEAEREKERERKRQEEIKQKEERARQKERVRREKEQQKEQRKLHLPQPKQKEEQKKATKLYLPTPAAAAAKKEADKSLTVQTKKGPGRPPKPKPSPPPLQRAQMPPPSIFPTTASAPPTMPEPEQAFSPSNPLMAVAAFNATTPAIDPALYNSAPPYTPIPTQRRASPQTTNKPVREPKLKKEKPPVRKRTPSPEIRECDYPPEALLKPAASYVVLIHEAITNSEENALTLPQIYKAIERKYPYFKVRVTTTGWQSSVRHNLGAHKAFCKVTRSGKGWMWGINEGVSIEKEKNKANIAASRPPAYQPPVQQPNIGLPYQNGNGGYHQQQSNGYPAHNTGMPAYVDQNHVGAGQRPMYQQPLAPPMPQYQMSSQQPARIPPMPMAYQPPTQTASVAAPPPVVTAASIGQVNRQSSHQFPNAPIPSPAGNHPAQQPKQNGPPPEMLVAIQGLQKQLSMLTNQNQGSAAGPSVPSNVSPVVLAQAQQLLAGLMSGKHTGRGASGNTDLVKQLTKAIQQGAGRNGAVAPVKSAPVFSLPQAPVTPSATMRKTTPTPTPAPTPAQAPAPAPAQAQAQAQAAASVQPGPSPRSGSVVDFKNMPPEQKKKLYRALLLAKEKKEREKEREGLREVVAGSPSGVKRPLDDGGAGPVAKKVDIGGVGGSGSPG